MCKKHCQNNIDLHHKSTRKHRAKKEKAAAAGYLQLKLTDRLRSIWVTCRSGQGHQRLAQTERNVASLDRSTEIRKWFGPDGSLAIRIGESNATKA